MLDVMITGFIDIFKNAYPIYQFATITSFCVRMNLNLQITMSNNTYLHSSLAIEWRFDEWEKLQQTTLKKKFKSSL